MVSPNQVTVGFPKTPQKKTSVSIMTGSVTPTLSQSQMATVAHPSTTSAMTDAVFDMDDTDIPLSTKRRMNKLMVPMERTLSNSDPPEPINVRKIINWICAIGCVTSLIIIGLISMCWATGCREGSSSESTGDTSRNFGYKEMGANDKGNPRLGVA